MNMIDGAVVISLVLGNTIAEDIIHLLEHFIDEDLRREIKQQYNKDQLPASYSQIGMETTDMMDGNSRNELIWDLLQVHLMQL